MDLAPNVNTTKPEPAPELDRKTLVQALSNVASYLNKKHANVTIVAVGGAVNTIFLEDRVSTHDVDFYNSLLNKDQYRLLIEGVRHAQSKDGRLVDGWLNRRTIFFIPASLRESLTKKAIQQNTVVFSQPGLKVLAAPWEYAFSAKLDRISGAGHSPLGSKHYDLSDAVAYIHCYLQGRRLDSVRRSEVESWAQTFATKLSSSLLERVNAEHQKLHGRRCIDMRS